MEPTWSQLEVNLGGACYRMEGFSEEATLEPTWPNLSQLGANLGQHDFNLSQLRANLAPSWTHVASKKANLKQC